MRPALPIEHSGGDEASGTRAEPTRAGLFEYVANVAGMSFGALGTAGLGFAFWWIAARNLPPDVIGHASAAISTAGLVAMASELGLGALLLAELQRREIEPASAIAGALFYAFVTAVVLGGAVVLVGGIFDVQFGTVVRTPGFALLFLMIGALSAATLVLDQALAALMRAGLQMKRNLLFGLSRLASLFVAVSIWGQTTNELHLVAAWLIGMAISVLWLVCTETFLRPGSRVGFRSPRLGRAAGHHLLNLSVQAPALALPVIATTLVSAEANAAFYVGLMLLSTVLVVPGALVTLIQAVATRDPAQLAGRLRFSLGVSVAIAAGAAVGFVLGLPLILALLGEAYERTGGGSLRLLGLAAFGSVCKYHYLAVVRLRPRLLPPGGIMALGAFVEIGAASLGGAWGGLQGIVNGWLVALAIESAIMLPPILRAAAGGMSVAAARSPSASREAFDEP